jgi:alpha-1,2-mannosyltransferase
MPYDTKVYLLYPPCNVNIYFIGKKESEKITLVSIGQFRPEKDHLKQVGIVKNLLENFPELNERIVLKMIGGVRNPQDKEIVENIKRSIEANGLCDNIDILENISYNEMNEILQSAIIGIHTMVDEHFGISVVEMMVISFIS